MQEIKRNKVYKRLCDIKIDGKLYKDCVLLKHALYTSKKVVVCIMDELGFIHDNKIFDSKGHKIHKIVRGNGYCYYLLEDDASIETIINRFILDRNFPFRVVNYTGCRLDKFAYNNPFKILNKEQWSITIDTRNAYKPITITITNNSDIKDVLTQLNYEILNTSTFMRRYKIC